MAKKFFYRYIGTSKAKTRCVFSDDFIKNSVSGDEYSKYVTNMSNYIFESTLLENSTDEEIFRKCEEMREKHFGADIFNGIYKNKICELHKTDGINQSELSKQVYQKETLVFYLSEPEFIPDFLNALNNTNAKNIYVLVSDKKCSVPTKQDILNIYNGKNITFLSHKNCLGVMDICAVDYDEKLDNAVKNGEAGFVGFGEDALMLVRGLKMPATVTVIAKGMPTKAVTGVYTKPLCNKIYIPKGFDIFKFVHIIKPTEVSYYHLSVLAEKFGEKVYSYSLEDMRKAYPELFLSIYDDHIPNQCKNDFTYSGGDFMKSRENYFKENLTGFKNVKYMHGCFERETFKTAQADWNTQQQQQCIVVDSVVATPDSDIDICAFGESTSPREYFYDNKDGKYFISNFGFFFTERLRLTYNALLADRKREQIDYSVGYIDYMRYYDKDGRRHETFPLFNKACFAKKKCGGYTAFNFTLSGGSITLPGGKKINFEKTDVNPEKPGDIAVYTPFYSNTDRVEDQYKYLKKVGENRFNIVIIGERILCVRKGNVCLPSIGVVLSLSEKASKDITDFSPAEDGYFDVENRMVSVILSCPDNVDKKDWSSFVWVYGGGLTLINGENRINYENYDEYMEAGGWLSPLSMQSQESKLHAVTLMPRTGMGVTEKGDIFVITYIGRSLVSCGADYVDMAEIASRMVEDISLFVSLDGGGSSVLGFVNENVLTEVSMPAPSDNSLYGMARKINSMVKIKIEV